jgi:hypothetical protein
MAGGHVDRFDRAGGECLGDDLRALDHERLRGAPFRPLAQEPPQELDLGMTGPQLALRA